WSIVIVLLLAFLISVGISIYVGHQMTHPEKKPIDELPSDYGIDYDDVNFISSDTKTQLPGWVLHPEEDPKMTVIFSHGYKGNRIEDHIPFFSLAEDLLARNY